MIRIVGLLKLSDWLPKNALLLRLSPILQITEKNYEITGDKTKAKFWILREPMKRQRNDTETQRPN